MLPFPAFASARTRSKKTLVPDGTKTASTSPLKPLRMTLRTASCSAIGAVLAEEGRDLARILGRTGERAVRPSQAAQRQRCTDAARRDQRFTPVDWLVPEGPVVVQLTAHAILLCR